MIIVLGPKMLEHSSHRAFKLGVIVRTNANSGAYISKRLMPSSEFIRWRSLTVGGALVFVTPWGAGTDWVTVAVTFCVVLATE